MPTQPPIDPVALSEWLGWGVTVVVVVAVTVRSALDRLVPRLRRAEELAATAAHEVRPNSGGSMRDSTDRIESLVTQMSVEMSALRDDVADIHARSTELASGQRRHDREIARLSDCVEQIRDRMTREADSESRRLDDHSERLHSLEALAIHQSVRGSHASAKTEGNLL